MDCRDCIPPGSGQLPDWVFAFSDASASHGQCEKLILISDVRPPASTWITHKFCYRPIFISFLAYCLHVTLRRRLRDLAPGLTARAVLEKFATIQMLDVHLPTTDQRTVVMRRYTQPESDVQLLLRRLKLELPPQPPPKIMNPKPPGETALVVKT